MGSETFIEVILAILLPPVGVFLRYGCEVEFWIDLLLTILGTDNVKEVDDVLGIICDMYLFSRIVDDNVKEVDDVLGIICDIIIVGYEERQGVDLLELGSIFLDLLAEMIQLLVCKT
ncbi:low temperature-induced protein [Quercus suber]|uniref:Low temperature-induced protein n=1 Tax=Quercus suber TaxID=58331 RepID=A0AAW0L5A7_QUESU